MAANAAVGGACYSEEPKAAKNPRSRLATRHRERARIYPCRTPGATASPLSRGFVLDCGSEAAAFSKAGAEAPALQGR